MKWKKAKTSTDAHARDLALGAIDVLISLGVTLADAGIVTRAELAATMTAVMDQQRQQDGEAHLSRMLPAEALRRFFSAPVFAGKPH